MSTQTAIKFFVKENGRPFPLYEMAEEERDAIEWCVRTLLPKVPIHCFFILDSLSEDAMKAPYGLLTYYNEETEPCPIPKSFLDKVLHKIFHVNPSEYGLHSWGTVEIVFETITPKKGIKASDLIASALKIQKQKQEE